MIPEWLTNVTVGRKVWTIRCHWCGKLFFRFDDPVKTLAALENHILRIHQPVLCNS